MKTAKEIFTEVWNSNFGNEDNDQLEIVLEHDYIYEAMERYAAQFRLPVVSGSLRMFKKQLREAVANYMYSEGCSCCRGADHDAHAEALAKLLSVKKYSDGSGFDFYSYRTGADKQ